MPAQQIDNGWHLDKKVPISIILVIVMQGVAGLWVIADIKKDIEILKASMVQQRERDDRQDKASIDAASLIRSDLRELGQKMDRLIERNK